VAPCLGAGWRRRGAAARASPAQQRSEPGAAAGAGEAPGPGQLLALQLSFALPPSTYATMLVRELTKASTATAVHRAATRAGGGTAGAAAAEAAARVRERERSAPAVPGPGSGPGTDGAAAADAGAAEGPCSAAAAGMLTCGGPAEVDSKAGAVPAPAAACTEQPEVHCEVDERKCAG
jgi:hypothetical protein